MAVITVKMADYKVAKSPDSLKTLGLGSCIGICIYDSKKNIIGMAHIMLTYMKDHRDKDNIAKYADTGIKAMVDDMLANGASKARLKAKIAGGAQMFKTTSKSSIMQVGSRNADAVKNVLQDLDIKIIAEDVGGSHGRTIEFMSDSGDLHIRTVGKGSKVI